MNQDIFELVCAHLDFVDVLPLAHSHSTFYRYFQSLHQPFKTSLVLPTPPSLDRFVSYHASAVLHRPNINFVRFVQWSPTTNLIAYVNERDGIYFLDADKGRVVQHLNDTSRGMWCLAWKPDGTQLAAGAPHKETSLWDVSTGLVVRTWAQGTRAVAWSPDGRYLATSPNDYHNRTYIYEVNDLLEEPQELEGHEDLVFDIAWNSDGSLFASASNLSVRIWDMNNNARFLHRLRHGENFVTCMSWSHKHKKIAVGYDSGVVCIWNLENDLHVERTFPHNTWEVTQVQWSPDDSTLAIAFDSNDIHLWNLQSSVVILTGHTDDIQCLSWSPDSTRLVSSADDKTIRIWSPYLSFAREGTSEIIVG